uniref:Uncharacterized protein n=1 Tax=Rhizophora mucronata TaxID=61149 RepID=A0A2P2QEP1_RHIMU
MVANLAWKMPIRNPLLNYLKKLFSISNLHCIFT